MATTQVRVPGGGNTFIVMGIGTGVRVAFLAQVQDKPGGAYGRPTPIHPVGAAYPVEIATPYAQTMGTLTLTVWARWGEDGWVSAFYNDKSGSSSPWTKYPKVHGSEAGKPVDLREVLEAQRMVLGDTGYLKVQKFERGRNGKVVRVKNYEKCVITDIDASDNINPDTMEQKTTITMNYAYITVATTGIQQFDQYVDM